MCGIHADGKGRLQQYYELVCREIAATDSIPGSSLDTVYFGGGVSLLWGDVARSRLWLRCGAFFPCPCTAYCSCGMVKPNP